MDMYSMGQIRDSKLHGHVQLDPLNSESKARLIKEEKGIVPLVQEVGGTGFPLRLLGLLLCSPKPAKKIALINKFFPERSIKHLQIKN